MKYKKRKALSWKLKADKFDKAMKKITIKTADADYSKYLSSFAWREKRRQFMAHCQETGKYFCYRCKTPAEPYFPVHHVTYRRVGDERFSDLRIICHPCHLELHPRLKKRVIDGRVQFEHPLDNNVGSVVT
jgi:hypothetical protein